MKYLIVILFSLNSLSCSSVDTNHPQEQFEKFDEAIPHKLVNPRYPRQAAIDRIEGFVRFMFNISSSGSVKNLKKIASNPPGVFDAVATQIMSQSLFKPAVKDGIPIEQKDMVYTMKFQLGE